MKYKECLAHCVARAKEGGKHWHVAYLEKYPIPSELDWDYCIAKVSAQGKNPANALHCVEQYKRMLRNNGIKTIPVIEAQYQMIARRAGIPPQFMDDSIMLMQMLHGKRAIL